MTYHDKIQLTAIIIAPPDQVAEGDRVFKSHAAWMESTHYRSGEKAFLSYNVVQDEGAFGGSRLCPDRQHVFRPD
jgi:hypothetical protein